MDLRKIKKLIDLLEESNLAEIEIKEGEESVRLARVPQGGMVQLAPAASYVQAAPAAAAPMPMHSPTEAATGGHAKAGSDLPDGDVVRWPMVGTFYASPAPDKPPFVTVGQAMRFLAKRGYMLAVHLEIADATIGGLALAAGMTTHSHKVGMLFETVVAYEVVLADGSLVRVTKDNLGTWARQLRDWGFTDVPEAYLKLEK